MERRTLSVNLREEKGRGTGRRLRRQGTIPGIVYGQDIPNTQVAVDAMEFVHLQREIAGENIIIDLVMSSEEKPTTVFIREIQRDPVTEKASESTPRAGLARGRKTHDKHETRGRQTA